MVIIDQPFGFFLGLKSRDDCTSDALPLNISNPWVDLIEEGSGLVFRKVDRLFFMLI